MLYEMFRGEEGVGGVRRRMGELGEGDIWLLVEIGGMCWLKGMEEEGGKSEGGNIGMKEGDEGLDLKLMLELGG